MDEDFVQLRIAPLTPTKYHAWSNDVEFVLTGKGLWKYGVDEEKSSRSLALACFSAEVASGSDDVQERVQPLDEAVRKLLELTTKSVNLHSPTFLPRSSNHVRLWYAR